MITIHWQLGTETGVEICPSDRAATKFTDGLYARKLSLIGLTPGPVTSFQNKVYRYGNMHGRKRRAHEVEIEEIKVQLATLQQTKLSISIQRFTDHAN